MMVVCLLHLINQTTCGMVNMIAVTATNGGFEPPCSDRTK